MLDPAQPFEDRTEAGQLLARALRGEVREDSMVLAIPRGGVVVGYEVAKQLGLELDVIVPRKIGAPGQPELAIGAVASWGDHERILDDWSVRYLGVSPEYIEREVREQLSEVNRRLLAYRETTDPPNVEERTVVLVDDGIATGYTTRAAAVALRNLKAAEIVLAVPVAPPEAAEAMRHYVDRFVCLRTPSQFFAVGYWYRDFAQVADSEVIRLLRTAREWNAHD